MAQINSVNSSRKVLTILGLWFVVFLAALFGFANYLSNRNTATIHITSESGARISYLDPKRKTKSFDKNDVTVKLKPGLYQLFAEKGQQKTTASLNVVARKGADVNLPLEKLANVTSHISGSAVSAYGEKDRIYAVNATDRVVHEYSNDLAAGRPRFTGANNIFSVYWLDASRFFFQNTSSTWNLVERGSVSQMMYGNSVAVGPSVSFNKKGAYSFVSTEGVVVMAPGFRDSVAEIGQATADGTQTSIAPDNSVLVYVPAIGDHDDEVTTKLYRGSSQTSLPKELSGLQFARWSTDSRKFTYSNDETLYVYSLDNQSTVSVYATGRTNPQSVLWLNATEFIYAQDNDIWRYDVSKNMSSRLGQFTGVLGFTSPFTLASDNQTVIFATSDDAGVRGGVYSFVPNFGKLSDDEKAKLVQFGNYSKINGVVYEGVTNLSQSSLESDQIEGIKYAIAQFASQNKINYKKVAFTSATVTHHDRASEDPTERNSIVFTLDDKPYNAVATYVSLTDISVIIYGDNGKQAYASANLDSAQ